ncbi:MAG: PHB depolymerase family esterase, partial [Burkholderiaceae bacterium]
MRQAEQQRLKRRVAESALRGAGEFLPGMVLGPRGARRYRLYLPPDSREGGPLPLLVMLHGCDQDAASFAASTRMNRVAERERFAVLYPEQDRVSNLHGCWHWFDLDSGRAQAEATSVLHAIDRVCRLHPVDPSAVAIAGLSAGASLAALLAVAHPARFCAVALHSGVPPGAAHSPAGALRAMRGRARSVPVPPPAAMADASPPWPPLLVLHGSRDIVVAPSNGRETALRWAQACGATVQAPRHEQRGHRHALCITD